MILKTITLVSNWESYTWLADGSPLERKDRLLDSLRKAFELVRKDVLNPEELNALGKLRIEAITKEIGA